jgi:SAM-dependent methyltransferase
MLPRFAAALHSRRRSVVAPSAGGTLTLPPPAMTPPAATPPPREPELLDAADLPYRDTERALAGLSRVNRALCGHAALYRVLLPRLLAGRRRPRLLDLGTGSGEAAARLARRAAADGVEVTVVGVDRKLTHLVVGRRLGHRQRRVVADAAFLPFRASAFDWATSTLFFHHFDDGGNRRIVAEMRRVAAVVAVVDLRRNPLVRLLARLLIPPLGVCRITRHDGALSADRSWPLAAVRRFAADLPVEELRRRFPFRFSLVVGGLGSG